MSEPYETVDYMELINRAIREVKSASNVVPPDRRAHVEDTIRRAEEMLAVARSKSAKELGLRGIQGVSSRIPWLYRLSRHGFRVHQYIFRKDFTEARKK